MWDDPKTEPYKANPTWTEIRVTKARGPVEALMITGNVGSASHAAATGPGLRMTYAVANHSLQCPKLATAVPASRADPTVARASADVTMKPASCTCSACDYGLARDHTHAHPDDQHAAASPEASKAGRHVQRACQPVPHADCYHQGLLLGQPASRGQKSAEAEAASVDCCHDPPLLPRASAGCAGLQRS